MDECSEAVRMNYSCGINANFASPNFDFDANNGTWAAAFKHLETFQIGQYMNHHWTSIETSLINCHCNRETICSQVKQNIKAVFEQRASLWSLSDPSANGQIVGRDVGEKKENEKEEIWHVIWISVWTKGWRRKRKIPCIFMKMFYTTLDCKYLCFPTFSLQLLKISPFLNLWAP